MITWMITITHTHRLATRLLANRALASAARPLCAMDMKQQEEREGASFMGHALWWLAVTGAPLARIID